MLVFNRVYLPSFLLPAISVFLLSFVSVDVFAIKNRVLTQPFTKFVKYRHFIAPLALGILTIVLNIISIGLYRVS